MIQNGADPVDLFCVYDQAGKPLIEISSDGTIECADPMAAWEGFAAWLRTVGYTLATRAEVAELCDVISQLAYCARTHGPGDDEALDRADAVLHRYRPQQVAQ